MPKPLLPNDPDVVKAVHEAGHVVYAWYSPYAWKVKYATLEEDEDSYGHTMHKPDKLHFHYREHMLANIACDLAGRECEMVILRVASSLSDKDRARATEAAREMVADCGHGKRLGILHVRNGIALSEKTLGDFDLDAREILEEARKDASDTLSRREEEVRALIDALLEKRTLKKKHLVKILGEPAERKWHPPGMEKHFAQKQKRPPE